MKHIGVIIMFLCGLWAVMLRLENIDMSEARLFIEFIPQWVTIVVGVIAGAKMAFTDDKGTR